MSAFVFDDMEFGKLARSRLENPAENFRWYCAEWIGEGKASALKLDGAEFRAARSGPRKGQLAIIIKGTTRTAVLSAADVKACNEKDPG